MKHLEACFNRRTISFRLAMVSGCHSTRLVIYLYQHALYVLFNKWEIHRRYTLNLGIHCFTKDLYPCGLGFHLSVANESDRLMRGNNKALVSLWQHCEATEELAANRAPQCCLVQTWADLLCKADRWRQKRCWPETRNACWCQAGIVLPQSKHRSIYRHVHTHTHT